MEDGLKIWNDARLERKLANARYPSNKQYTWIMLGLMGIALLAIAHAGLTLSGPSQRAVTAADQAAVTKMFEDRSRK